MLLSSPRRVRIVVVLVLAIVGTGFGAFWLRSVLRDPDVSLLLPEAGAEWIRMRKDEGPDTYGAQDFTAAFRTRFTISQVPSEAVLHFRAFRFTAVFLNGVALTQTEQDFSTWKQLHTFDLAPFLYPGTHELMLSCINRTGPPAVLAYCDALDLRTGRHWQGRTLAEPDWIEAVTVADAHPNEIGYALPPAYQAFLRVLPLLAAVFAAVSILALLPWTRIRERNPVLAGWMSAGGLRWTLLAAFAVLAINNISKLPYGAGFDIAGHLQYILVITRHGRIPIATEGWQLFQSPLYYLVSTPLYLLFDAVFSPVKAMEAMRIVPLLCGALHIQVVYLVMREVYPSRGDLQALGTLLGGLMPINLYMSQYLGNEPMAALFTGLVVLSAVRLALRYDEGNVYRRLLLVGLMLGLALLTKVTIVLLCVPLSLLLAYLAYAHGQGLRGFVKHAAVGHAITFGTAFVVCSWYYIFNYTQMGVPFMGGWDEARGYIWWQEPGYRTIGQFVKFGEALRYPVYASVQGFWDGFYSTLWLDGYNSSISVFDEFPMWNYDLMLATAWLSLAPTVFLLLGTGLIVWQLRTRVPVAQLFCLACLGIYIAAMLQITLRISGFSTVKASYTLGLLSCYAVIAAAGFGPLLRNRVTAAMVWGVMVTWAVAVYAAYFVR